MENAHIVFISWGLKGQEGINKWLSSSSRCREIFEIVMNKLHAYEVSRIIHD